MTNLTEMAKELYDLFTDGEGDWETEIEDYRNVWIVQAKHVQKMVLEARIEDLEHIHIKGVQAITIPEGIAFKNRISDLQSKLKALDWEERK